MHPRILAQRQAQAHQRVVEAISEIASTLDIEAPNLMIHEKSPDVQRLKEWEVLASWLEHVPVRKDAQGSDLREAIQAATDEELEAIPGVGAKTIEALRTWANEG